MSGIALPSAGGSAGLGRFAVNALGAGVGFYAYFNFIRETLPNAWTDVEFFGTFGLDEMTAGACALMGAMLANSVYNRIGG